MSRGLAAMFVALWALVGAYDCSRQAWAVTAVMHYGVILVVFVTVWALFLQDA